MTPSTAACAWAISVMRVFSKTWVCGERARTDRRNSARPAITFETYSLISAAFTMRA